MLINAFVLISVTALLMVLVCFYKLLKQTSITRSLNDEIHSLQKRLDLFDNEEVECLSAPFNVRIPKQIKALQDLVKEVKELASTLSTSVSKLRVEGAQKTQQFMDQVTGIIKQIEEHDNLLEDLIEESNKQKMELDSLKQKICRTISTKSITNINKFLRKMLGWEIFITDKNQLDARSYKRK